MKKVNFSMMLLLMGVLTISVTSCKKDDDDTPKGKPAKYVIATTIKNPDGKSGSSYMQLISDLEGKVDNSNAMQISFGMGFGIHQNDIYLFPTYGKDGNPNLQKYTYTGTDDLGTVTELNLPPVSGVSNLKFVNEEKAYAPAFSISKILIINPKTMQQIGSIDVSKYAHGDNSPDPSNGIIRDGYYYQCLAQGGGDYYMPYDDYHQVDVLVIDTQTDEVVKMISETKSTMSFPTRPMDATSGMIFTDEQNDIYITCVGKFGMDPTYTNSGFVCIPNGKQEFDDTKTWDISNTPIEGTEYKPASIMNCKYIGNGKIVAFVTILELFDPNNPYSSRNLLAVLMDMKTKTIKHIKDIPATDGHSVCIKKYQNDLLVMSAYGKEQAGFFTYNTATEEVKFVLETVGNPIDFHYFK
ncbi:MAG: hypothetical protein CSB06_03355 [Bacteroidia bacterium]|nr:MAG: hypothetical protein CSB06_03355 [Bacteroidia bacterium]